MARNFGKSVKRFSILALLLVVAGCASCAYMLPGQSHKLIAEPRYAPALAIACWKFESLSVLTTRQRFLWRYELTLEHQGPYLSIGFEPRQPNPFTQEKTEMPRKAWGTHILVDPQTFRVVRWYLAAD